MSWVCHLKKGCMAMSCSGMEGIAGWKRKGQFSSSVHNLRMQVEIVCQRVSVGLELFGGILLRLILGAPNILRNPGCL